MDPATVIVVLATHLFCTGGLLHLVGRQMPPRCGIQPWAAGLMLFGSAYGVRLALGTANSSWMVLPTDVAMMAAALCFRVGLGQFVDGSGFDRARLALVLGAFTLADAAAIAAFGALGRQVVLNCGLGVTYVVLSSSAHAARRRVGATLQRPLVLLTGLILLLGLATFARGVNIGMHGLSAVLGGTYAKVYYAWASLAAVLLAMTLLWMVFVRLSTQLAETATHDALTRVLNRNGLEDALRRHFGTRPQQPLTLLAIDIDLFKGVNDQHGHAAGDRVLRALAEVLVRHLRPNDVVARLGGEEFVVCTPVGEPGAAHALAERLRAAVAATAVPVEGGEVRCTLSIGVSPPCTGADAWDAAYTAADRALYAAKSAGRDRVVAA